jgi:hypothetical protein
MLLLLPHTEADQLSIPLSFKGVIDDLKVYPGAASLSEHQARYEKVLGKTKPGISSWKAS